MREPSLTRLVPMALSYQRGHEFLLATASDAMDAMPKASGRRGRSRRAMAEALARKHETETAMILKDARFAAALDIVVRSCGKRARDLILSGRARLTPQQVGTISRMAPERQRYEMQQVAQGRRPFRKPKSSVPVFDTTGYHEVLSRLRRAEGLIRQQDYLLQALATQPTVTELAKLRGILPRLVASARKLSGLLRLRLRPASSSLQPNAVVPRRPPYVQAYSLLASAQGLVEKNVRDIPRLPNQVRATKEQRRQMAERLAGIVGHSRSLVQTVGLLRHGRAGECATDSMPRHIVDEFRPQGVTRGQQIREPA